MRYSPTTLARVRDVFSDLFGTRGEILSLLAEAHIAAHLVNLEQNALAVWSDAVDEADKLGLLRSLLQAALLRYPTGPAREALLALGRALDDEEKQGRWGSSEPKNGAVAGWNG
jgi:hypothetical protein